MKRFLCIFIVVVSNIFTYVFADITQYSNMQYKTLTTKEGLSQMTILDIIQDAQGYMWFATREGLNRFDGKQFVNFKHQTNNTSSISSNYTTSLAVDKNQNIWVGTHYGLNCYNPRKEVFENYYFKDNSDNNAYNRIRKISVDSNNTLWLGTKGGLFSFNPHKKEFKLYPSINFPIYYIGIFQGKVLITKESGGIFVFDPYTKTLDRVNIPSQFRDLRFKSIYYSKNEELFLGTDGHGLIRLDKHLNLLKHYTHNESNSESLSNNSIRSITEDKNHDIVVATFDGISILSTTTNRFVTINDQAGYNERFSHFSFHSVYIDNRGTLWGGTWAGGLTYGNPTWEGNLFKLLNPYPHNRLLGIIGPLVPDENGIWIGMEGSGLVFYNRINKSYQHIAFPGGKSNNIRTSIVTAITKDASHLYVGTNNGLIVKLDRETKRKQKNYQLPEERSVVAICAVGNGKVLVGTNGAKGLLLLDENGNFSDVIINSGNHDLKFDYVRSIRKITDTDIIILTQEFGYYRYNLETMKCDFVDLTAYSNLPNVINCVYLDRNSQLWFGTSEDGLYWLDLQGKLLGHFSYPKELASNTVNAIAGAENGDIWFSQLNSISRLVINTKKIENYTNFDVHEFSTRSSLFADDVMYFGGDKGLIAFNPSKINKLNTVPPLVVNTLSINNVPLKPTDVDFRNNNFELRYNQSNITIEYAALEYLSQQEINFAYKLDGFDKEWNYVGNDFRAYYTNLPSGKYRFLLKTSMSESEFWSEGEVMLTFEINPPPWKSWWAYLIYTVLLAAIGILIFYYMKIQLRLKNNIILEKEKQINMEKLHEDRIMLFTNLSHELRTPLSLIIGPLESILSNAVSTKNLHNSLELILKNARRLLFIANELLDFRKKESSTLELKVAPGNFSLFVYEITLSFSQIAEQRSIKLIYDGKDDGIYLWYDRFWIEKVLFNILSNAFKNTPDGGTIELVSTVKDSLYNLLIKDSGSGIPENQLDAIFEPFYQVQKNENNTIGTGIGLSLAKGIIELHSGQIVAQNNTEGGACFTIYLKLARDHFSDSQIVDNCESSENTSRHSMFDEEEKITGLSETSDSRKTILVVEDNKDLRNYLREILQKHYKVLVANNGIDGLAMAMNTIPDFVLSDIMMPKMDGIELCKQLKTSAKTGHIPVVLLTARSSIAQVQEGLSIGADDYFIKPFNPEILISKIRNILASRNRLQVYYGKTFGDEVIKNATNNVDKDFANRLYATIETNISHPDFSTDMLGKKMGMSKTNLYKKTKELTNYAPSELIRKVRLDLSEKFLLEGKIPISEIAMNLGFRSTSYFSSFFKTHYKVSPSEYLKRKSE